jgi:SHS2 domain-containing protein
MVMRRKFEEIDHTADIAVRVWGRDLGELFSNAAVALAHMLDEVGDVSPTVKRAIELEAEDVEILLVDWLSELLYLEETQDLVFSKVDRLQVIPNRLRADIWVGPRQEPRHDIKAVTFSELHITQSDAGYETVVVFDV